MSGVISEIYFGQRQLLYYFHKKCFFALFTRYLLPYNGKHFSREFGKCRTFPTFQPCLTQFWDDKRVMLFCFCTRKTSQHVICKSCFLFSDRLYIGCAAILMCMVNLSYYSGEAVVVNFFFTSYYNLFCGGYLRVVSATFLLVCFSILKESNCETRQNVFYFTAKALFV